MIRTSIRSTAMAALLAASAVAAASAVLAQDMPMVGGAPMDPAKTITENASKASNSLHSLPL